MWTIKSDNYIILDETHHVYDATLDLAMNTAGQLVFTIDSAHENFNRIHLLDSVVDVYDGSELVFRGRPIQISINFRNQYVVTCEGDLAYLNDILIRPFSFPVSPTATTPADYFEYIINQYNSKAFPASRRFAIGTVEVRDPNNYVARSDTEYTSAWQLISEGLLDVYGGFVRTRHTSSATYIDYKNYSESEPEPTAQGIRFGINLFDMQTERKGTEISTAIIPLGAETDNVRLTISSLPDGWITGYDGELWKDGDRFYNVAATGLYGNEEIAVVFDDITTAANLLTRAIAYYANLWHIKSVTKIKAVDCANLHNFSVPRLKIGDVIPVVSEPHQAIHGFASTCMIKQLHINLLNDADSAVTVETEVPLI